MPYRSNPFLERMSERTTSDHEFARLFSPRILDRLEEDAFDGGVHVFRSAPGAGKTTLLRAFTPASVRAFWHSRGAGDLSEAYQRLVARGLFDPQDGPQILGVYLSCASGFSDLPPGAIFGTDGLFRGLLDCRVVMRALRSAGSLIGLDPDASLTDIRLEYSAAAADLREIPRLQNAQELIEWAEKREQGIYLALDALTEPAGTDIPSHVRFESVLWFQSVSFRFRGRSVAPRRLIMIDDMHKLRPKQRSLLIEELVTLRAPIPIWLAERTIALKSFITLKGT